MVFLSLLITAGCLRQQEPVAWELTDGTTLGQAVRNAADSTVVLVYDPSMCFTCTGVLSAWLNGRWKRGNDVLLFFSHQPSKEEEHQAKLYRLPVAGILKEGNRHLSNNTSLEMLFVRGKRVAEDTLHTGQMNSSLLQLLSGG